jgi:hypothetical protein
VGFVGAGGAEFKDNPVMADLSRLGKQVTEVVAALGSQGVPFAVIGGLALSAHGVIRATADVDLLAPADRAGQIDAIAAKLGYRCLHRSADAANYVRIDERLDLLLASRPGAVRLLGAALPRTTLYGEMPVVSAEGLIGFKLQAWVNDRRRGQDIQDIRKLLSANRDALNLGEIREYFRLFEREALLEQLLSDLAADGVQEPPAVYDDSYVRFDDLMCVVEQLCPVWPEKPLWPGPGARFLL